MARFWKLQRDLRIEHARVDRRINPEGRSVNLMVALQNSNTFIGQIGDRLSSQYVAGDILSSEVVLSHANSCDATNVKGSEMTIDTLTGR